MVLYVVFLLQCRSNALSCCLVMNCWLCPLSPVSVSGVTTPGIGCKKSRILSVNKAIKMIFETFIYYIYGMLCGVWLGVFCFGGLLITVRKIPASHNAPGRVLIEMIAHLNNQLIVFTGKKQAIHRRIIPANTISTTLPLTAVTRPVYFASIRISAPLF